MDRILEKIANSFHPSLEEIPNCIKTNIEKSGSYLFAYKNKKIYQNLLGEHDSEKANDYLFIEDSDFRKSYFHFYSILNNGYFDPIKRYNLSEYYISSQSDNHLDFLLQLFDDDNNQNNMVFIGEKGSGKTATLNCWIRNNIQNLDDKRVFYLRCDGHHLYNIWNDYKNVTQDGTPMDQFSVRLNNYFNYRLPYIYCKFCAESNSPLYQQIDSLLKEIQPTYRYPLSRAIDEFKFEERSIIDGFEDLKDLIRMNETKLTDESAFHHILSVAMHAKHKRLPRRQEALSTAFESFLANNNIKILQVVDGVDNIIINDIKSRQLYAIMIDDCNSFLRYRAPKNVTRLMVMRSQTFIESRQSFVIPEAYLTAEPHSITHRPPEFKHIFKARFDYHKAVTKDQSNFSKICDVLFPIIRERLNEYHNDDVRSFMYNMLTLIGQIYYRLKQKKYIPITNEDVELILKDYERRNLFLNGRHFLQTHHDTQHLTDEHGLCCMNPFYYDIDKYASGGIDKWYGLSKTRILQLLIHYENQSLTLSQITRFLSDYLAYPEELVSSDINDLRRFCHVDTNIDLAIKINEKGKRYIYNAYSNYDVLYYFALDTPLPEKFIKLNMVTGHRNRISGGSKFIPSALRTTLTFIYFLNLKNILEQDMFQIEKAQITDEYKGIFNELSLPYHHIQTSDKLIDSYKYILKKIPPHRLSKLERTAVDPIVRG